MGQKKQQIAESLWKKGDLTTTDASRGGIQSPRRQMSEFHRKCLVGGFKDVFSISYMDIYGIILPIDFHMFHRGWNHQPVLLVMTWKIWGGTPMTWQASICLR
jgi:hypothetical protein